MNLVPSSLHRLVIRYSWNTESSILIAVQNLDERSRALRGCVLLSQHKLLGAISDFALLLAVKLIQHFQRILVLTSMSLFAPFHLLWWENRLLLNTHHCSWRSSHTFILTIISGHLAREELALHRAVPLRLPFHLASHDTSNMLLVPIHAGRGIGAARPAPPLHKHLEFRLLFLELFDIVTDLYDKFILLHSFVLFYEVLGF